MNNTGTLIDRTEHTSNPITVGRPKHFVFTLNNYNNDELSLLFCNFKIINCTITCTQPTIFDSGLVSYLVVGKEIGKSGTPHLQGYIEFTTKRTYAGANKLMGNRCRLAARKGTQQQAADYCKEDGDFKEWGTISVGQGTRTDLLTLRDKICTGTTVDNITESDPHSFHTYGRTLNKIEDIRLRKRWRTEMTQGIWYFGRTNTGKSHQAFTEFDPETTYSFVASDKGWWDGYCQQPTVVINEFRGEIPYNTMLQLVDKWPFSVPRRGREPMPFTSSLVIVTSSLDPSKVYWRRDDEDSLDQLLRRFIIVNLNLEPDPDQTVDLSPLGVLKAMIFPPNIVTTKVITLPPLPAVPVQIVAQPNDLQQVVAQPNDLMDCLSAMKPIGL